MKTNLSRAVDPPPYPCSVCCREWRGFAFKLPRDDYAAHFCSMECSEVYMQSARHQKALTCNEDAAALAGGKAAGAYLDTIGKTDLSDMSAEEWNTFCGKLFAAACADLARQADEAVPF